jgi:CheY-like chemotaxis protein
VVRSLVKLHGGSVSASSEGEGRGSVFRVLLPLCEPPSLPVAAARTEAPAPARRRVVIVEDNEDIRESELEMLSAAGHQVETASDGPAGTETILRLRPDVAFVDVGLPGFDGLEVARRVRRELGSSVVLVAVSGYGREEDRAAALAAGFDWHLVKPAGLVELQEALRLAR